MVLKTWGSPGKRFVALELVFVSEWAVHWCLVRASDRLYFWPHPSTTHVKTFFSAVWRCVFRCLLRWSFLPKALLQTSHLWGRTPVWIRLCRVSSSLRAKRLSQPSKVHWKGFSPVWIRKCPWSCPLLLQRISHSGQGYFFFFLVFLFKVGTPKSLHFSSKAWKHGADFTVWHIWSEFVALATHMGEIIVLDSVQKLIGETWTFTGDGGVATKAAEVKLMGAIDCFHNPDEGPSSGGRRICWIDGSDGAWKRIVGLNTRNKPRLFCVPCMIWTVHSSTRHEMCSRWQDGIDTEWGGVMNHQSEGLFSRKL